MPSLWRDDNKQDEGFLPLATVEARVNAHGFYSLCLSVFLIHL